MSAGVNQPALGGREANAREIVAALSEIPTAVDPWQAAAMALPILAVIMGARRAFLAGVVGDRLQMAGLWRAAGVLPGPHLGHSMKAVRAVVGGAHGTVFLTATGPAPGNLAKVQKMMRLRDVPALVMTLPQEPASDAVVMGFEVPEITPAHIQRDGDLINAFSRSLSGILALRERADSAVLRLQSFGRLAEIAGPASQVDLDGRLRCAVEMVLSGTGSQSVLLVRFYEAGLQVAGRAGEPVDAHALVDDLAKLDDAPLPYAWSAGECVHHAYRVRAGGALWGALITIGRAGTHRDPSADAAHLAALGRDLVEAAAHWIGGEIDRDAAMQELRWREADLAALAARQHGIGEDRRRKIAHELNDDVGQELAAGIISIDLLIQQATDLGAHACRDRLVALRETQRQAIASIRAIATRLRPALLDSDGLAAAIRFESERLALRTPLKITSELESLDPATEGAVRDDLFRIAEEALSNVTRHAHAEHVHIRLATDGAEIMLIVEDDGVGIAPRGPGESRLGILGMCERARRHGGTLSITRYGGTCLQVRIPVTT